MTETDYLRAQLIKARELLARQSALRETDRKYAERGEAAYWSPTDETVQRESRVFLATGKVYPMREDLLDAAA